MSLPQIKYLIEQDLARLESVDGAEQFMDLSSRICGLTQEANFAVFEGSSGNRT